MYKYCIEQKKDHCWMGMDRYQTAVSMLEEAGKDFDVEENTVYWCENRNWSQIQKAVMEKCE